MSAMRNPAILSASSSPTSPPSSERARNALRGGPSLFDACRIGVVLRTVVFVEAVVAIATLFVVSTPTEWLVQAATGMMLMGGQEGDGPVKTGFPLVDAATAMMAALAIVSALRERDQTGFGRFIDVPMTGAALQLMYPMACAALTYGRAPPRVGNQEFSGSPASDVFDTADGPLALGANTPRQFISLLGVLGCPEWAHDPALFEAPLQVDAPAEFLKA
eukprot:gene51159-68484_t